MATTIVTKSGSGAPTASDLVAGELAVDLTNKRLYTEDSGGTVLEVGSNPYNFTANHDGSAKLATTATGIDVTGTVTADGLTVDGSSTFDDILLTAVALPSAGNPSIVLRNTDNNIYIQAGSGNAITFLDSSQNTMLSATPTSHSLQISNGNAFAIDSNRDISFYEDTGSTAKLTWSASNESLTFGTNLAITTNEIDVASGDLTLDVAGDIILDADSGAFRFKDAGTTLATFTSDSGSMVLYNATSDKDLIFKGNDGGSTITALTLDMSNAGAATFNSSITIPDWVYHSGDSNTYFGFPSGDEFKVVTANVGRLHIKGSESVWNEGGGNVDFRVESDSNSSAFFVDAAEDNVLMGRTSAQSYENTASTINVEATGSFSTSAVVKTGVGTTYVDSGWTFGNSRQVWLITLVGTNSTSNAHSTVAYIATVGAYNKTLVQLGNASDHFDNGYLSAQLDSGSASTVNLQVRWNSLYAGGTSDVTVQGLRLL